ncbi:class C sortase [Microbacterium sp. KSW4-11]|uniref:Class C sortase n=1 Tax=Microbacterium gawkjiense TaxID=3067309 RepID=A0ABU3G9F4_9MICO|nr:class C sortase [Microbacterium sp. KSW4-11]MDT3316450.1 class C sortase [Microbacterium sp. KSW4-11]
MTATAELPSRGELRRRARWRLSAVSLLIGIGALIAVGLLLYPSAAAWFSQYEQSQRIDGYGDQVQDLGAGTIEQKLQDAREYNAGLAQSGAQIGANERLPIADDPDQGDAYASQLRGADGGLMARLRIPVIDLDLPIYHGTSEAVLHAGVGHLEGTALPVGGPSTHSVLTAHRGLASAELFTHLDQVSVDDTFTVEVFGDVLSYRVIETRVVEPEDTRSLFPRVGEDLMTLVTCTPLGVNSHRILVTAERIIPTPQKDLDAAGERPEIPRFAWWAVGAGGAVLIVGLYIWWSGRPVRPVPGPAPVESEIG